VGDAILPARGDDAGAVLTGPPASRRALAAGLLFFLSGAAALVYQVAWQRILALHSGMALYSMAMIVAAFMAGLGIGSHLGGVVSSRLGRRTALGAFALVELGIGAFGACSPVLYYAGCIRRQRVFTASRGAVACSTSSRCCRRRC